MDRLIDLYTTHGQSPWLDNLKRGYLASGELAGLVARGVRGLTSNPSIFQKAIAGSADYDEQFGSLTAGGLGVVDAYWQMVIDDINGALEVFAPLHASSGGTDGYVSVEVAPELARDTDGTIAAARHLSTTIARPNLMVKIPGTAEGLPAIEQMIAEGRSINVTLIFSLDRYDEVMEAYLRGLERAEQHDLSGVASVASFFISRVDTEVDRRLEAIGSPDALALRGQAAVAQAKLAYARFRAAFSGPRWDALVARGARLQRPLWASTSTKNPEYRDTLYVDELIGPDTVNTLPDTTLEAFADHGRLGRTIDADVADAERVWEQLATVGVDMADVARVLEDEGVAAFEKAFDELIASLDAKRSSL